MRVCKWKAGEVSVVPNIRVPSQACSVSLGEIADDKGRLGTHAMFGVPLASGCAPAVAVDPVSSGTGRRTELSMLCSAATRIEFSTGRVPPRLASRSDVDVARGRKIRARDRGRGR